MTRAADIKNQVRRLLQAPDLLVWPPELPPELASAPAKAVLRALLLGLSTSGEDERWRAVGLVGFMAARLAAVGGLEPVREVLRRLMWSLNEESGGIGWAAPQALGEILHQVPALAGEYGKLLCSYLTPGPNYLEHPPLQAGAAWGVGRLAQADPGVAGQGGGPDLLLPLLAAPQPEVRGCAAWALGVLAAPEAAPALARLAGDRALARLPWEGALANKPVADIAAWAAQRLAGPAV
ncbi:MAG: HEAT repeat domain-containing protein [Desulfarculus sp.]|nr:HEAT repeat domain-containing protein [Desulfarculus sp.]